MLRPSCQSPRLHFQGHLGPPGQKADLHVLEASGYVRQFLRQT